MIETRENIIDLGKYPKRYNGNAASPFRYPGGKGFLTPFLADQITQRFPDNCPAYAEPYCGGAGSACNLLVDGVVRHVFLNDTDHRIYSAWRAMLHETDRFLDRLDSVSLDIGTWENSLQKVYERPSKKYDFEIGFATFFVNRTSRSGVILGSGPIGGYSQDGKWKIGARFNKTRLSQKIRRLGDLRENISLYCMDGLEFCKKLSKDNMLDDMMLFVDPPYVEAGGRLYFDGMTLAKHDSLADWLLNGPAPHWILTYDDHPTVKDNFSRMPQYRIQVRYSLRTRRLEKELLYMTPIVAQAS